MTQSLLTPNVRTHLLIIIEIPLILRKWDNIIEFLSLNLAEPSTSWFCESPAKIVCFPYKTPKWCNCVYLPTWVSHHYTTTSTQRNPTQKQTQRQWLLFIVMNLFFIYAGKSPKYYLVWYTKMFMVEILTLRSSCIYPVVPCHVHYISFNFCSKSCFHQLSQIFHKRKYIPYVE